MATRAPVECEFYADDKADNVSKYLLTPLSFADIENVNLQARARLIKAARVSLQDCKLDRECELVLDAAMRTAAALSMLSKHGAAFFSSVDGMALVLHQSMKAKHPQVTLEHAADIIGDNRNAAEFSFAFDFINGGSEKRPEVKADNQNPIVSDNPQSEQNLGVQ